MLEDYTTFSKEKLTRENLVKNFNFISDARAFLADREDYYSDDPNEVYDRYLEHFRYQNYGYFNRISGTDGVTFYNSTSSAIIVLTVNLFWASG